MSGHRWSPAEMPSLTGPTAVVTGANSGIGWHTALELARHGATVTMAVRTKKKGDEAAARISDAVPGAEVHVPHLDLVSLESVESFADSWQGPLGLLVNNAGVMAPPRYRQSTDGYELQFATNHLGHLAPTGRLRPSLLEAPRARVVPASPPAHTPGKATVIDANPPSGYNPSTSYGNTKLANLLFFAELQRRASLAGTSLPAPPA